MKICIDLTSLADNFSGIERYAASLTYELINDTEEDMYILLFKESVHKMFLPIQKKNNVKCIILPRCNKLIFNQLRLPFAINKIKADWYLFLAFPVPVLCFKKNMISTIHDICCWDCPETMNGVSKWYFRISHRIAMLKCKRIITISEFSKKRIIELLKFPREKIWLIYCGVDEKFLRYQFDAEQDKVIKSKYKLPEEYILSLSTLEPRKNIRLLIEAYQKLVISREKVSSLVLAGRKGWKMDELLTDIEKEVQNKIIFTGFIDDDDLPSVYANAKLFIFPSMYEGFGIPPLEAMACGTLVLSSNATSLPEVLGDASFYFENENRNDLSNSIKKMEDLLSNEKMEFVNRGFERVILFSWREEAKKLRKYMQI